MRSAARGAEPAPAARARPARPGGDAGHRVAFDARMGYTLRRAARGGWNRSFGSGDPADAIFPLFPSQQQGQGLDPGELSD